MLKQAVFLSEKIYISPESNVSLATLEEEFPVSGVL